MKRMSYVLSLALVGICLLAATAMAAGPEWESLFDGKKIEGFTQLNGTAKYTVKDGAIVGTTVLGSPNSFLCTDRLYGNFILEVEFKVNPQMNSGIQIRSESHQAHNNGRVHGYQVEIDPSISKTTGDNLLDNGQPAPADEPRSWTGGIYGEGKRGWLYPLTKNEKARKAFKRGDVWNHLRVEAIDDSIKTWLNGVPAADLKDSETPVGFIALQVHGTKHEEPMQIAWRNIRIKDLDKAPEYKEDPFMGNYESSKKSGLVAQVLARGWGKYQAFFYKEFDKRDAPVAVMNGKVVKGKVVLRSGEWRAEISDGKLIGAKEGDAPVTLNLKKVKRVSPTIGLKPERGAIILFDGNDMDEWRTDKGGQAGWKLIGDGVMEVAPGKGSILTKRKFTDYKMHVEFRTPYMPKSSGQHRANSGVYLSERYETQILDSFALEGAINECGALYREVPPDVNMCFPPMDWQTYEITLHAPKFDASGKKMNNARLTIVHNGVTIHDDLDVPAATGSAKKKGETSEPMSILLQDHKNPAQFRNIWIVDLSK